MTDEKLSIYLAPALKLSRFLPTMWFGDGGFVAASRAHLDTVVKRWGNPANWHLEDA